MKISNCLNMRIMRNYRIFKNLFSEDNNNNYLLLIGIILLVLFVIGSRLPISSRSNPLSQTELSEQVHVQDMGPTEDGSTALEVVNSVPYPMTFRISAKNGIETKIKLDACSSCRIYAGPEDIPEDIHSFSPKQVITVSPGRNLVTWNHQGGNISPVQANWDLKPGHKYFIGPVVDKTRGRSNWDSVE